MNSKRQINQTNYQVDPDCFEIRNPENLSKLDLFKKNHIPLGYKGEDGIRYQSDMIEKIDEDIYGQPIKRFFVRYVPVQELNMEQQEKPNVPHLDMNIPREKEMHFSNRNYQKLS